MKLCKTGRSQRTHWIYRNVRTSQGSLDETIPLADRACRRDRAAPLARRLAAGVGSGITIPRATAGRMGPSRLAEQARTVAAQRERVLGCAGVATTKTGGRNVSRYTFRFANAAEKSRRRLRRRADAQPGHR